MRAIEVTGTVNHDGHLLLDHPLILEGDRRVRVIVLFPEDSVSDESEIDPDDDLKETVIEGLQQGWQQAMAGNTLPLSQLWEETDAE